MGKPLYKTTIVIWSEDDPLTDSLSQLAYRAEEGDAYCSVFRSVYVALPDQDDEWDDTEFFDLETDDEGILPDGSLSVEFYGEHDDCPITLPHNHYVTV